VSNSDFDVIVIGSGIGGLTTASLLAQLERKRVLVLERHFKLGGFTHTFSRPGGYVWDVGVHYVGNMAPGDMGRQLFDLVTQGGVTWQRMPSPFEKFVFPDFTLEVPDDPAAYQQALSARFPAEAPAIARYFKDLEAVSGWLSGYFTDRLAPAFISAPARLLGWPAEKLALLTTRAYLDARFHAPQLKAVLASQWGDYGLPPAESAFAAHAMIATHYLYGAYYPVGSAARIAASIAPIIEAAGGRCLVHHEVRTILVEAGRGVGVRAALRQGARETEVEFRAPLVISDAGAHATFTRLLPESVPVPFRRALEQTRPGHGVVTVYLGLQASPAKLGFRGENHWLYAGYDHDELFARRNMLLAGQASGCYLSFPSLKDPAAQAHTAEIIAHLDYAAVAPWQSAPWRRRGPEYAALKQTIADTLLAFVEAHYPGFRALVDFVEVSTPLTDEHFTGHAGGAIYGVPARPERYRQAWLRAQTPVKGLYLSGTDAGALGVMGAMMGGAAAASQVLGARGFPEIMAAARRAPMLVQ